MAAFGRMGTPPVMAAFGRLGTPPVMAAFGRMGTPPAFLLLAAALDTAGKLGAETRDDPRPLARRARDH